MKILYVTTIGKTMRFFESFIKELINAGHSVDIATNENNSPVPEIYHKLKCNVHQIVFSRVPISLDNIKTYSMLKKVIKNGNYDIVHCHTPNASVITRLVCNYFRKKTGLKVFYTAHGFHFYKGAPALNWLVYYPVEKFCSYFTDKLITINQEDYKLAQNKFKAKEVYYVPGVGIDLSKFENIHVDIKLKRREIGVPEDAILLLSVGELNENKNHQVIIKALAKLNRPDIHYAIAGEGEKRTYLLNLARNLGVEKQVHLLGYREDVKELNYSADIFCFPSIREGLGISAIEAMYCGLPIITSNVHGINDYSINGVTGYKCQFSNADDYARAIKILSDDYAMRMKIGKDNNCFSKKYNIDEINQRLWRVYRS